MAAPLTGMARVLGQKSRETLKLGRALKLVWQASALLSVANAVIILAQAILPLLFLYTLKLIIDFLTQEIAGEAQAGLLLVGFPVSLPFLFVLAGFIAMLQGLAGAAARMVAEIQAQVVTDHMYSVLHDKATEVDLSYYEQPSYRDTLHRAQMSAHFRPTRILQNGLALIRNLGSLLVMAGLLISFHWAVVPLLILVATPGVLLRLYFSSDYYSWERRATADERLASYYNEILNTEAYAKEMRLFDLKSLFRSRFLQLRKALRQQRIRRVRNRAFGDFAAEILTVIGVIAALAYMAGEVIAGALTIGSLVMYSAALQRAWSHLGQSLYALSSLYEDNLFLTELYEFLDIQPTVTSPPHPAPPPRQITQGLVFDNVSFTYPTGTSPAISNISMHIKPGEHIALVGHNGGGKSTLVKLLCRLYDPTEGSISVDGIDIRELDIKAWRRKIGALTQDYCRYQLTARENIWLGDVHADPNDPRVDEAAKIAGADQVFQRLSDNIETLLGHRFKGGHELSGGQWQKVALARLFMRDAEILILDEPTSALDPEAEDEILRKFNALVVARTAVLVSHRLSAVRMVDKIYMLEHGQIVESGHHDALMRRQGPYARLYEMQAVRYRE